MAGTNAPGKSVRIVPVRHYGRWVTGVLILFVFGAIVYSFANAEISYSVTAKYLFSPRILSGAYHTLLISVISMAAAIVLGCLAAVARESRNPVAVVAVDFYVLVFRGTPTLVQLLIWYNLSLIFETFTIPGIYSAPMNEVMTPFMAAFIGLTVHVAAYITEIIRAGITSVDDGQIKAAMALGMTRARQMRKIILPQALPAIIPPVGNQFIALLKYSSLAYVIQYHELLYATSRIYTSNLQVIALLFTAAIWYLVMTTVASVFQRWVEMRVDPRRTDDAQRLRDGLRTLLRRGDTGDDA